MCQEDARIGYLKIRTLTPSNPKSAFMLIKKFTKFYSIPNILKLLLGYQWNKSSLDSFVSFIIYEVLPEVCLLNNIES